MRFAFFRFFFYVTWISKSDHVLATVLNCRGSRKLHCALRTRECKGCLKRSSFFFYFPPVSFSHYEIPLVSHSRTKSRSSRGNVRMTTDAPEWNYKVSRHYVSVLCFFSEIIVTGISMCNCRSFSFFLPSSSLFFSRSLSLSLFFFRKLPFAMGWTLLRCQVLVFWEKGLRRLSFG